MVRMGVRALVAAALATGLLAGAGAAARAAVPIKMCTVQSMGGAPSFIAKDKGFFAREGLDAKIVTFSSAQPIALAVASGDCDFAATAMTAAFFNLAGQGTLKIIAAGTWERRGFQSVGMLVSNKAYARGLHSFKDLGGHSVAITQLGTPLQHFVLEIAEVYRIPETSLKFLPLQSNAVVASAIAGGQADSAVQTVAPISAIIAKGDARLLGWVTDVLPPHQGEAVFTATKTAKERPTVVKDFIAALRAGEAYFHDAFVGPKGERRDGPHAAEIIAIAAKYLQQPEATLRLGIPYYDPEARISSPDIERLSDWYAAQHMLKTPVHAKDIVDTRFTIEMPK
ncbi:MAG TPA: ABC transporter substrate-binding protein [Stellaceae bacterium]|jgi:NitT/TauT family transport system substrate-binding protein|nr:ABC transporter substrate-binding protein [Stellaceae bacterium]